MQAGTQRIGLRYIYVLLKKNKRDKKGKNRFFSKKGLTNFRKCSIILKVLREWRNRQTRTFEGRVSLMYGFKSRFPHQKSTSFDLSIFHLCPQDTTSLREAHIILRVAKTSLSDGTTQMKCYAKMLHFVQTVGREFKSCQQNGKNIFL